MSLIIFNAILDSDAVRGQKAKLITDQIRAFKSYSWVGLYDVLEDEIQVINWSGTGAPAYLKFPRTKGINGRAVAKRKTIAVNDTSNDPDYLTTFGNTQSEIIVTVFSRITNEIIGTIDVESQYKNAFDPGDIIFIESCSKAIERLWEE